MSQLQSFVWACSLCAGVQACEAALAGATRACIARLRGQPCCRRHTGDELRQRRIGRKERPRLGGGVRQQLRWRAQRELAAAMAPAQSGKIDMGFVELASWLHGEPGFAARAKCTSFATSASSPLSPSGWRASTSIPVGAMLSMQLGKVSAGPPLPTEDRGAARWRADGPMPSSVVARWRTCTLQYHRTHARLIDAGTTGEMCDLGLRAGFPGASPMDGNA